jgi:hypothetical protein
VNIYSVMSSCFLPLYTIGHFFKSTARCCLV